MSALIDIPEIRSIQTRIAALQQRFGIKGGVPGADFQSTLNKTMQQSEQTQQNQQTQPVHQAPETFGNNTVGLPGTGVNDPDALGADRGNYRYTTGSQASSAYTAGRATGGELANPTLAGMIGQAATKYNVSPKLLSAIAEVESGGNQSAVSPAGAIGVMQLMPDTAAGLGVNPYDEQQNIEGGAKYIRQMLDEFGGDVRKAVAAYNAGPQAVKEYGGVPPYSETQNYVDKVLDLYR